MKSHRGLSSAVGAVFLIAIVIGSLSYITYSLEIMGNFSEVLITEDSRLKDKQGEAFEITSIDIAAGKLDVVIKNTGQIPLKITTLYIDEMGVNDVVNKTKIDKTIAPGTSFDFLTENIDIDIDPTKGYNLKLITSRGETQTFYLNSASQEPLDIQLIVLPEIIPTGFSTTLMMIVVNNMSNNNPLINLTPIEPACSGICEKLFGPTPATYDTLNPGDAAIFEWSYTLDGDDGESIEFISGIENGFPGNTDSETVTIKTVELSEVAGESIVSSGFGTRAKVDDVFVLHEETFGIPSGADNYQLSSLVPDSSGTSLTFDGIAPWLSTSSDTLTFWSSNVTVTDAHFPAGNWNASLRYYHDALPSVLSMSDIGMNLHFEDTSPSTGLYDSGTTPACYNLAESGSASSSDNVTWYPDRGVNGSGAYYFNGNNARLTIQIDDDTGTCLNGHHFKYSVSGWFNATKNDSYHTQQNIISLWDVVGDGGGFAVYLGDGTSGNHGKLYFTALGDDAPEATLCEGGSVNYMDNQWHHFVGTAGDASGVCKLYIDGVLKDTTSGGDPGHWDIKAFDEDYHIGADRANNYDFTGYIDDIMFWMEKELSLSEVTALKEYSFGYGATKMDFLIGNYTDAGVLVGSAIIDSQDYPLKWGDPGHYAADSDDNGLYRGGNYTVLNVPEVRLNLLPDHNRLGFTMSFASGEPLYLNIDDSALDGSGSNLLSSYLQPPTLVSPQILPAFFTYTWDQDLPRLKFFAYNAGDVGVWFTYQGTRIVLDGENGNYSGLVDKIDGATMNINSDSPFVAQYSDADIDFFPPQAVPINDIPPTDNEKVIPGTYDVTVFLNGYDEYGIIFVRSIILPTITVIE